MSKNKEVVYDYKFLKDTIIHLGTKHDTWKVFNDFLAITTYSISNVACFSEDREKEYLKLINSYSKDEQKLFPMMLTSLVNSLDPDDFNDVLGTLFEELELHNKWKGQFFTPDSVCKIMSEITLNAASIKKEIEDNGYITLSDPACGSGRLFYSALKFMKDNNINFHKQVFIEATDVSSMCVYMTFIQLSLYGANAKVILGNTLSLETYDVFYTPMSKVFPIKFKKDE